EIRAPNVRRRPRFRSRGKCWRAARAWAFRKWPRAAARPPLDRALCIDAPWRDRLHRERSVPPVQDRPTTLRAETDKGLFPPFTLRGGPEAALYWLGAHCRMPQESRGERQRRVRSFAVVWIAPRVGPFRLVAKTARWHDGCGQRGAH